MTAAGTSADIVLADWGTSSLRLWAVDRHANLLDERRADSGMGTLARDGYAPELRRHLAAMGIGPDIPVLICGMAGAAQGWQEAPYLDLPADFTALANGTIRVSGQAGDVRIIPGLAQRDAANPDVIRGEETILHGLASNGIRDGTVCLPGTHSKWARIADGRLVGFRTMMTGEMFALLGGQSILRHTVTSDGWSDDDFMDAVRAAHGDPTRAIAGLFGLRAGPLLFGNAVPHGGARLSGLMIGAEIAVCLSEDGGPLHLAATGDIASRYAEALRGLGISFEKADADAAVRAGLFDIASCLWPDRIPARNKGDTGR